MTAVTLGPARTYSPRATHAIADEIEFYAPVTKVIETVATGTHDQGVTPIDNRIEGSVTESLDALRDVHRREGNNDPPEGTMSLLGRLKCLLPSRRSVIHYRCAKCGERVLSRADVSDPECPSCASTELIDLDE